MGYFMKIRLQLGREANGDYHHIHQETGEGETRNHGEIGGYTKLFCVLGQTYFSMNEIRNMKEKRNLMKTVNFGLNEQMHFRVIY